jgi:hypothetical protein
MEARKHSNMPGIGSVFRTDNTHIALRGKISGNSVTMTGSAVEAPGIQFQATMKRLRD